MVGTRFSGVGSVAIASTGWSAAISEDSVLASPGAINRRDANQPPKNKAVIAIQTKI